jgi:hypothetical protein
MGVTHHLNPPRSRADNFRFSENNFDLIRLIAAGEVAIRHRTGSPSVSVCTC